MADCNVLWQERRYSRKLELWWANRRPGTSLPFGKLFASACSLCKFASQYANVSLKFALSPTRSRLYERLANLFEFVRINDALISIETFHVYIRVRIPRRYFRDGIFSNLTQTQCRIPKYLRRWLSIARLLYTISYNVISWKDRNFEERFFRKTRLPL